MNKEITTPKNIRSLVGQIPDPEELYGREDFIEHLWHMIRGNNILLLAPRRFGKSGVMRHVLLRPKKGYLPLSFELEDVDSPEEFVWRITRELLKHDQLRSLLSKAAKLHKYLGNWLKSNFDEVEFEGAKLKFKADIKEDWREAAKRMLTELEKADHTILFLFDEFPAMLDRLIEKQSASVARDFLAWFRTVRMEQKDVLRRHRFIVAGSVGIDQILRKLGASDKLVDFGRLAVEPLDQPTARNLVRDLAHSCSFKCDDAILDRLLELIGAPVPYFIHIFISEIAQLPGEKRNNFTVADLDAIYKDRVLGPTCRHYFRHYSSRLQRYGKADEKAALAVLRGVAEHRRVSRLMLFEIFRKARGKTGNDQAFDELMADLECDWYLRLDTETNEFYFLLKVMQDWWRRWHPISPTRKKKGAM